MTSFFESQPGNPNDHRAHTEFEIGQAATHDVELSAVERHFPGEEVIGYDDDPLSPVAEIPPMPTELDADELDDLDSMQHVGHFLTATEQSRAGLQYYHPVLSDDNERLRDFGDSRFLMASEDADSVIRRIVDAPPSDHQD